MQPHALLVFPLDINLKFTPRDFAMLNLYHGVVSKRLFCVQQIDLCGKAHQTQISLAVILTSSVILPSLIHVIHERIVSTCQCKVTSGYYQLFFPSYI